MQFAAVITASSDDSPGPPSLTRQRMQRAAVITASSDELAKAKVEAEGLGEADVEVGRPYADTGAREERGPERSGNASATPG